MSILQMLALLARRWTRPGVLSIAALLTSPAGAAPAYSVIDLGTLGGTTSYARGINNLSQVVGYAKVAGDAAFHAFVYRGGALDDLGLLTGSQSYAEGINDAGQIAGYALLAGDASDHPFIYANGVMTELPGFGTGTNLGWAINESGQIVGGAQGGAYFYRNGIVNFPAAPASTSFWELRCINDAGQTAGYVVPESQGGITAIMFDSGVERELGTLGGTESLAFGINNAGEIVGSSKTTGDAATHAFLYVNGTMTDLGSLGGTITQANDINNLGQVVGYSQITGNRAYHAFLYSDGRFLDLNDLIDPDLHISFEDARAVNDLGQIIANGTNALGQAHGFLLTPIPEPTLFLPLSALACYLSRPRRRR
jgi:probable HAF family extracellular repeat protein